jgi:UDP-N-acetylglucosamine 4,6-dehydratase/5-epimerase
MVSKKKNLSLEKELKNKTILVTGGAGSIGSAVVKKLLEYPVRSVRVLDLDEYSLFKLKRSLNDQRLRLLLGSILDQDRVEMAGKDVDIIIHAAAIKNVEISESNPIETIDVNTNGTKNMIKMAMKFTPKKFLNISTDKAADAATLYGTTKQLGERLTSWAGFHGTPTKFASVRLGNVIESRGNVFDVWRNEVENHKPLSITDASMKRYFFHMDEAIDFIFNCLIQMKLGEIFVPKMKAHKIIDLANKISKKHKIIGLRQGEKMEEVLITVDEKKKAIQNEKMWIIKPYS